MKIYQTIILLVLLQLISSCNTSSERISNPEDYDIYLELTENETYKTVNEDHSFWIQKLKQAPNQFPYLAKIAASQSQLFHSTGNIDNLIKAEEHLILINKKTKYNKAGYLRALARNYITQHKFKAALNLLRKAEVNGVNLKDTQKPPGAPPGVLISLVCPNVEGATLSRRLPPAGPSVPA